MTCVTVFAEPMAMPTTQLTGVIQYEDAAFWQLEGNSGRKSLRMSWVVVTDNGGRRQLRMQWDLAAEK
ncbi:MAG: hypothetical protein WA188_00405 [Terriglobales bacterium]